MSILLIEDEASLRDLYCEILREICPCKAVALAEEALEKLTTGYFELVMTDIGLPGMAGDALVRRIHLFYPDVSIIVISGAPLNALDSWSSFGVSAYLQKPVNLADLESCVKGVLHWRHLRSL